MDDRLVKLDFNFLLVLVLLLAIVLLCFVWSGTRCDWVVCDEDSDIDVLVVNSPPVFVDVSRCYRLGGNGSLFSVECVNRPPVISVIKK